MIAGSERRSGVSARATAGASRWVPFLGEGGIAGADARACRAETTVAAFTGGFGLDAGGLFTAAGCEGALKSAATSAEPAAFPVGFCCARMRVLRTNGPQEISSTGRTSQALILWPFTYTPAELASWTATRAL